MAISTDFVKQPWFKKLGHRASTYFEMIKHLEKYEGDIIETGTAWCKDNWNGQGQSTLIWDWVAEQLPHTKVLSLDISPEHIAIASEQTKYVTYMCGDSVKTLNELSEDQFFNVTLLYLDSYDWHRDINLESAFHHMAELAAVWCKLRSDTMIVVDDRHGLGQGKHWLVESFMKQLNIEPAFVDYQIGWVKP